MQDSIVQIVLVNSVEKLRSYNCNWCIKFTMYYLEILESGSYECYLMNKKYINSFH